MSGRIRAVDLGLLETDAALAHDEALGRNPARPPTLLLWRTAPAVVIGRFQRADWEVDAAACAERAVGVWRRFTGGGAVYLDPGTLCVAIAAPPAHEWSQLGVPEMYSPLLDGIVRACRLRGVPARRDERTVRVGDRKVTGIAAHRGRGGMLVHGTLLIEAELGALRACLAGPRHGDLGGAPNPAPSRPDHVVNVGGAGWERAMVEAFDGEPGRLSDAECAEARRLRDEKYHDPAWHAGSWSNLTPPAVRALLALRPAEPPR
ncbi:MAG TPA: lipoate--protein ligase family protein [Gaiellales bacterium]